MNMCKEQYHKKIVPRISFLGTILKMFLQIWLAQRCANNMEVQI